MADRVTNIYLDYIPHNNRTYNNDLAFVPTHQLVHSLRGYKKLRGLHGYIIFLKTYWTFDEYRTYRIHSPRGVLIVDHFVIVPDIDHRNLFYILYEDKILESHEFI